MDEELKYDKCAHITDGIMHGTVPLEDTLVWFLVLGCFFLIFCLDMFLITDINW